MRRGFTLVELMVVVVIAGVFAALAVVSLRRARNSDDVDGFANAVRNAVVRARARAIATRSTWLVDLRADSVAYCQRTPDPAVPHAACPAMTALAQCWEIPCESARPVEAGNEAVVSGWRASADLTGAGPQAGISAGKAFYVFCDGTVSETFPPPGGACAAYLAGQSESCCPKPQVPTSGFTIYVEGRVNAWTRRKIVVAPLSGRPRVLDVW